MKAQMERGLAEKSSNMESRLKEVEFELQKKYDLKVRGLEEQQKRLQEKEKWLEKQNQLMDEID